MQTSSTQTRFSSVATQRQTPQMRFAGETGEEKKEKSFFNVSGDSNIVKKIKTPFLMLAAHVAGLKLVFEVCDALGKLFSAGKK